MEFPSGEWVSAWLTLANEDPACVAAGAGFKGAVGAMIRSDANWHGGPIYLRLEGGDGIWTHSQVGFGPDLTEGTLFTLSADYIVWKSVLQQQLDPIRGLIQGRLRVRGQLSSVLRWARAFRLMTALASRVPTTFADEAA